MSAQVIKATWRRSAHGLHTCWACGGRIASRDRYLDLRMADGGTAYTLRVHGLCEALWVDAGADEDWSWTACGQEALSEWTRGFVNALAPGGAS